MISENCDLSAASLMENPPIRMNSILSAECLEKASSVVCKTLNKKGFKSLIPRSPLAVSNSCNDALKNDLNKCKGKPSMIPKSKSIKRTEKGNVKIELSVQSEEISAVGKSSKNELTSKTETEPGELKKIITKLTRRDGRSEELRAKTSPSMTKMELKEGSENLETEISSTSLKSCGAEIDIKDERLKTPGYSATSTKSQLSVYRDAEEDLENSFKFDYGFAEDEKTKDEKEAERQEKRIRTLYETLKSTGSTFDNFKWICKKNQQDNTSTEEWQNFSVQKCYDVTLEEISDIWKSTMSLISSVKDHAIRLIEEKEEANSLDREQLILESEMVQLAVDFAINYSKLKTDCLIKSVGERLGVENLMKTSLEEFMDSKTFPAMYNDEDLETMSQTIKDLNANVLKEEDLRDRVQTCRNFTNPFSRWCL